MTEKLIFEQSNGLKLLGEQTLSCLNSNLFLTANSGPIVLYLAAIVSTMCRRIVALMDLTETCTVIYIQKKNRESNSPCLSVASRLHLLCSILPPLSLDLTCSCAGR